MITILTATLLLLSIWFVVLTCIVNRMSGGGFLKLPWKLDQLIIGVLTGLPAFTLWFTFGFTFFGLSILACSMIVYAIVGLIAFVMKIKGHGQWMTLVFGPKFKYMTSETWDILLVPFFGKDPRTTEKFKSLTQNEMKDTISRYGEKKLYWRCVSGLFVSGASVGLGLVIALIIMKLYLLAAITFGLYGLSKSLSYMLGWKLIPQWQDKSFKYNDLNESTEIGEFGTGVGPGIIGAVLIIIGILF